MRHRILVADDEENIRFLWRTALLKPEGAYDVVATCDGREALEEVARSSFDLVITDIKMPRMDGMALTEAIRRLGYTMPIIWFTAQSMPGLDQEAGRLDVHCCLYKPLRVRTMRQTVADALSAAPHHTAT
jgi:CheY-like chemotaxis protein